MQLSKRCQFPDLDTVSLSL